VKFNEDLRAILLTDATFVKMGAVIAKHYGTNEILLVFCALFIQFQ
jgi:hypothetical protein